MTNQKFNAPNLDQAEEFLRDLFEAVTTKESELAGGEAQELARGSSAVQMLKETNVTFGKPIPIALTEEGFQVRKIELNPDIQDLMKNYDFYSMIVVVNPRPQPSVLISRLECQLDFGPKGINEPVVYRIIPNSKWKNIVNAGVKINMGLDGDLDVAVGVDDDQIPIINQLPNSQEFKAKVNIDNALKSFLVLEGLSYQLGKFDLFAQGEHNSECFWRIERPEIKGQSEVKFNIVFHVPKGCKSIDLVGKVWIEPSIDWLNGELVHVMKALPSFLKDLFGSKEKAAKSFAVGKKVTWQIELPQN